jgi:hypothetical protein
VIWLCPLAVALTSVAGDGTPHADDWLSLDREIETLALVLDTPADAPKLGGYLRTSFQHSDDILAPDGSHTDGFFVDGVWLELQGSLGGARYDIGVTGFGSSGTAEVRNATASVDLGDNVRGTLGQYKPPLLYTSNVSRSKLVFYDRTDEGSIWNRRDVGGMLGGRVGPVNWRVSAQNGGDKAGDDLLYVGHVTCDVLGAGVSQRQEGGFGVDVKPGVTAGLGYADERGLEDGQVFTGEVEAVAGRFFFHSEILDYGDGFTPGAIHSGGAKNANGRAGTQPFDATLACMLTEQYELAARYEDFDDTFGTQQTSLGVNKYVFGHACKWQLNWTRKEGLQNIDVLLLGLTIAF